MPDRNSPYKLDFDDETRACIERAICRRVQDAVAGAEQRNSNLKQWNDQLYGYGVTSNNLLGADGCDLYSSVTEKAYLTLLAQIVGATHRDPMVAIEAFTADDEEGAEITESWLAVESSKSEIPKHIYNFAGFACRDPATVGYVGWVQETKTEREVGYRKAGDARVYSEEEREDEYDYEEVPVAEEVTEERYDIRTIPLRDFYLYPPNAVSVDRATAVAERMALTADELFDGIDTYGYDEEAVEKLVRMSMPQRTEDEEDLDSVNGLDDAPGKDGLFTVYTVYTRLPRLLDGEYDVPKYLLKDDFLVVCAPDQNIVLKMAFSPFKQRPYFVGGIMPDSDKPAAVFGRGLPEMVNGWQAEATKNIQQGIDAQDLIGTPCLVGPPMDDDEVAKIVVRPGAYIGITNFERVRPLEWNRSGLRDMLAVDQWINNQVDALVSAQGQGQLSAKVRKQGEIDALQQQTSAKFGMYLSNFQRTIVKPLFERLIALKEQFGDVDDDGEDFIDTEGRGKKLTARALRGKYNVVPVGTSMSHSPEALVEVNKHCGEIQAGYLKVKQAGMKAEDLKLIWHGAREQLRSLGVHNPEAWLGKEPQDQPEQPMQPPQMQPTNGNGMQPPMGMPPMGVMN